jgi:hypothetical protein
MNMTCTLRLRAEIVIELDATDFVEAASHQNRLEQLLDQLHDVYPRARLSIRERRDRGPRPPASLRPNGRTTGRLHKYDDA